MNALRTRNLCFNHGAVGFVRETRGRPGRGKSSRPPSRFSKNRFRQRLTISRRVLRLLAMSSFERPCAARRIILARATIKYGNVYLLARRSSSSRSCLVRTILNGLFLGKSVPSQSKHSREGAKTANNTVSYLLRRALSLWIRSECRRYAQPV